MSLLRQDQDQHSCPAFALQREQQTDSSINRTDPAILRHRLHDVCVKEKKKNKNLCFSCDWQQGLEKSRGSSGGAGRFGAVAPAATGALRWRSCGDFCFCTCFSSKLWKMGIFFWRCFWVPVKLK